MEGGVKGIQIVTRVAVGTRLDRGDVKAFDRCAVSDCVIGNMCGTHVAVVSPVGLVVNALATKGRRGRGERERRWQG